MTVDVDMLYYIKDNYPDLESEVRGILMSRAQDGATIVEIRDDYYRLMGMTFPVLENITEYLLSIPYVSCYSDRNGTRIFNIVPSEKTSHLFNMVLNQKPAKDSHQHHHQQQLQPQQHQQQQHYQTNVNNNQHVYTKYPRSDKNSSRSDSEGFHEMNCFYEDNYNYLQNRLYPSENVQKNNHMNYYKNIQIPKPSMPFMHRGSSSPTNTKSSRSHDSFEENDTNPNLCDFQLLGDDFFLYMAKMELNFKFRPDQKILQSGFCISGLSITDAIKRVQRVSSVSQRVIVNIGSVDILSGIPLVKIEHNFLGLLHALYTRGVNPILTTLAPLANLTHDKHLHTILLRFNDFIRRQMAYQVIDIYTIMVSDKGHTLFDCYQSEPRRVTGCQQAHVFWNKIGRQRVLKKIIDELEY